MPCDINDKAILHNCRLPVKVVNVKKNSALRNLQPLNPGEFFVEGVIFTKGSGQEKKIKSNGQKLFLTF